MAGHSTIQTVIFSLSSDDEIVERSQALITSCELYDSANQPVHGGVNDIRLGTTDHNFLCITCGHNKKLCMGHRGHLPLRVAVPQPIAIAEIRKWLKIICFKCGEVVVDEKKYITMSIIKRLSAAATSVSTGQIMKCPRKSCGAIHPIIVKDEEDHFTLWADIPTLEKKAKRTGENKYGNKLYPNTIKAIFERVNDATVEIMGRVHPKKLILTTISIPPNTIRPSVKSFGSTSAGGSYHDSTGLLQHIIKRNSQLPEQLPDAMGVLGPSGPPINPEIDKSVQNLQQLYYDLIIGSSSTNASQGSKGKRGIITGARPVNSFLRNLMQKEGRVRANLLGKRTFYMSRSTISGNMRYKCDQIGVPLEFARTLQVEETVQEYNKEWLMTFFLNGRKQYPGCTHIVKHATGQVHDVSGLRTAALDVGDVLFRDVVTGDCAYFNRAPTLERSSIGVHTVIVIQDPSIHTLQINVLACEWYNADFDGDQMNLWVARKPASRAEAMIMSNVSNWFISTKNAGPVNGEVQDSVIGCYELTKQGTVLDKYHAMALFTLVDNPPSFETYGDDHIFDGRDIVTMMLSETPFNYSREPTSYSDVYRPLIKYNPKDTLTTFEHGKLIQGVLDKRSIGDGAGGVFHLIGREYGSKKALDVIFYMQQIALHFMMYRGFTIGTADLILSPSALEGLHRVVSEALLESSLITDRLVRGEIVPPIDSTVSEFYEQLQHSALTLSDTAVLRWVFADIRPDTNGLFKMVSVGSKGTNPNLIHISGAIGQTIVAGSRIPERFAMGRTSPYFPRFATDPAAYGFVKNSYICGMTSVEYIGQSMNGRFDLINKALTTASSGYFMRKGIMSTQSAIIDNHRHVVNDTKIVQMIYGDDGLDPREVEKITIYTALLSDAKLREYVWVADAKCQSAIDAVVEVVLAERNTYRKHFMRTEAANFQVPFTTELPLPINVRRLVAAIDSVEPHLGDLATKIESVQTLCEIMPYMLINEIQERARAPVSIYKQSAVFAQTMVIRAELSPKVLATISEARLALIIETIRLQFSRSLIDYGTAVGILAAQAISQPLTQYMLDSHHRSVSGGTSKDGLMRLNEICGAKDVSDEQFSIMQIMPLPGVDAQEIANTIEYVTLERFTKQHDILLEPYGALIYPPYLDDAKWITEFEHSHPLIRPPSDLTNWCFRFVIDKAALVLKAIDLDLIVQRLRNENRGLHVVHTAEAVPIIMIRVWSKALVFKRNEDIMTAFTAVFNTPIRGIKGVTRARVEKAVRKTVAADGALVNTDYAVVKTAGTNLYHAMLHPKIDKYNIVSNSIGDTYAMFGIEAARARFIGEMNTVSPTNPRHLFIYADIFTRTGKLTSIERGGLSARDHNNVLLRMAYGAPIQVATDAALTGIKNKVCGIAGPQLLGAIPQIGTLYNSFVINEELVGSSVKSLDSVLDDL